MTDSRRVAFCDLRGAHVARAEVTEAALLRVARSGRYVLGAEVDSAAVRSSALSLTWSPVVVAGACQIDDGAFLGAGAVLVPEVHVGNGAVVGAGAVVVADVAPGIVVVGNPARLLRPVG